MNKMLTRGLLAGMLALISMVSVAAFQEKELVKLTTSDNLFSMSFPKGWMLADMNDPVFLETMESIRKNDPKIGKSMEGSKQEDQTLMAFNTSDSIEDGMMDTMNVIAKADPGLTPAMYKAVADELKKSMPFKKGKMDWKTVDTPMGKTLFYTGTLDVQIDQVTKQAMDVCAYLGVKNGKMIVITFSTGEGQMKDKAKSFEQIVKTAKF